jgi:hypothetical protein
VTSARQWEIDEPGVTICIRLAILGSIEPVGPELQLGAGFPEVVVAQGVPCEVGTDAASSISGTATHPPSVAANNGARTATARRNPEDRLVAGIGRSPFGIGAGPALMLPYMASARDAVPSTVFGKG